MAAFRRQPGKTLVDQMAADLRRQIAEGAIVPEEYLPTEMELRQRYQVSRVTVRRTLKRLVEEQLLISVPHKGHRPAARKRAPAPPFRVAYVVELEDIHRPWTGTEAVLLSAIQGQLLKAGAIGLAISANQRDLPKMFAELRAEGVSGAILDTLNGAPLYAAALAAGLPFVVVNSGVDNPDIDVVLQDNFNGTRLAMQALLAAGHRRIGYAGSRRGSVHAEERYAGYRAALYSAGVNEREADVIDLAYTESAAQFDAAVAAQVARPDCPTGFVCAWEAPTLAFCRQRVRAQGGGPAIVGWASAEEYQTTIIPACAGQPPPAAMVWRPDEMAALAIERLRLRCAGGPVSSARIHVPYRLQGQLAAPRG